MHFEKLKKAHFETKTMKKKSAKNLVVLFIMLIKLFSNICTINAEEFKSNSEIKNEIKAFLINKKLKIRKCNLEKLLKNIICPLFFS